jgi:hypothetical protein
VLRFPSKICRVQKVWDPAAVNYLLGKCSEMNKIMGSESSYLATPHWSVVENALLSI